MHTSKKVFTVATLILAIFLLTSFTGVLKAQEKKDSLWVHITEGVEQKENGKLALTIKWELVKKEYSDGEYAGEWQPYSDEDMTFKILCATDSAMNNVVKSVPVKGKLSKKVTGLEWGTKYFIAVEPTNTEMPWRNDAAEGEFYATSVSSKEKGEEGGFVDGFIQYTKDGGKVMAAIYGLALFGFLFVFPLTWWKLRLANIFPPNKPGFLYTVLPTDKVGKTDIDSPKGNLFLKEVAKYWGRAMQAMSLKPEDFGGKDEFISASRQEQEEQEKRMWIEEGEPNVEKAIEVCRSGVPGVKLKKKPTEYPITKVLLAALENHRANKNNWWASQEMDRATENTALKELDDLRGWNLSALWAIGSVEPMLGLFGTVIGIRAAFGHIETLIEKNPEVELTQIVPKLAGGIYTALITTITGLGIGIPFMLLYYYYKGKLDYVFGKWEEIVVEILNLA